MFVRIPPEYNVLEVIGCLKVKNLLVIYFTGMLTLNIGMAVGTFSIVGIL
jgi:hypothetical protein